MQTVRESLFARSTTIFGVCEALGEDFGVSPTWFRVLFATGVLFNLEYAIAAYAIAGALVLISRFAYPDRRAALAETEEPAATAHVETVPAPVPAMAEAA